MNIHKHPTAVDDIFGGALPHNIEAEQCLIGAIFINNDAFAAIKGLVTAEDFFEPINREIFNNCGVDPHGQTREPPHREDVFP